MRHVRLNVNYVNILCIGSHIVEYLYSLNFGKLFLSSIFVVFNEYIIISIVVSFLYLLTFFKWLCCVFHRNFMIHFDETFKDLSGVHLDP